MFKIAEELWTFGLYALKQYVNVKRSDCFFRKCQKECLQSLCQRDGSTAFENALVWFLSMNQWKILTEEML